MFWSEFFDGSLCWLFPLVVMALCIFMMRGRKGSMMCGFGSREGEIHRVKTSDSVKDILDKRYAVGEIGRQEYEEKKVS
jgi:alkylhydroperoxidase/carboxymuconolactone decarboxylase family protein YurZ